MWLEIGITLTVVLLITMLIAICEVWCKIESLEEEIKSIKHLIKVHALLMELDKADKALEQFISNAENGEQ
jgi:hypothetical protein